MNFKRAKSEVTTDEMLQFSKIKPFRIIKMNDKRVQEIIEKVYKAFGKVYPKYKVYYVVNGKVYEEVIQ